MTDFAGLLKRLREADVRFVLVGGFAATIHGSPRTTVDLDIVYARDSDNLSRLSQALAPISPYLRGAPRGLPFRLDADTLARGLNFTLTTDLGDLDLLGEAAGDGTYENLSKHTMMLSVFGAEVQVVTLEQLIHLKRAAGRKRDLEALAELEALLEERREQGHRQ